MVEQLLLLVFVPKNFVYQLFYSILIDALWGREHQCDCTNKEVEAQSLEVITSKSLCVQYD